MFYREYVVRSLLPCRNPVQVDGQERYASKRRVRRSNLWQPSPVLPKLLPVRPVCISHFALRSRRDIHRDAPPLLLTEPREAEDRAGGVADDDGGPDVLGFEAGRRLEEGAQAERNDHLRDDRDVQRAARVARSLQ